MFLYIFSSDEHPHTQEKGKKCECWGSSQSLFASVLSARATSVDHHLLSILSVKGKLLCSLFRRKFGAVGTQNWHQFICCTKFFLSKSDPEFDKVVS